MKNQVTRTSKFMSYVLRHNPSEIGIELDKNGWVDIDQFIERANEHGKKINRSLVEQVVVTNDKQRFAISEDGKLIRANQGHSVEVELALEPQTPPKYLLHGTAEKNVDAILNNGLNKMSRHHVHLTESMTTAHAVGQRYGKVVIFEVNAEKMASDGFEFYKSENNVWLVESVPARYLEIRK